MNFLYGYRYIKSNCSNDENEFFCFSLEAANVTLYNFELE